LTRGIKRAIAIFNTGFRICPVVPFHALADGLKERDTLDAETCDIAQIQASREEDGCSAPNSPHTLSFIL
jgi:hypothetical protein